MQLACKLGWPVVNAATKVTCKGDVLEVERTLEDAVEVVELSLIHICRAATSEPAPGSVQAEFQICSPVPRVDSTASIC